MRASRFVRVALIASLLASAGAHSTDVQFGLPDTELMFTSNRDNGRFQMFRMHLDGSRVQRVIGESMEATHIAWSPDGKSVAFASVRKGQPDLYIVDLATGLPRPLTNDAALESTPVWSPNGGQLVYQSYRDSTPKLYVSNADGSGQRRLTDGTGEESAPAFSPDGRQVAYIVTTGRRAAQIHTVDVAAGRSTLIGANPATGLENMIRWSPDGSRIAYVVQQGDATHIYTMRADGSDRKALTVGKAHNNDPQWSPDGRQILFLAMRDGSARQAIYAMNADGSQAHELVGGGEEHLMARWSADGRNIYFVRFHRGAGQIFVAAADGSNVRKVSDGSGYDAEFALPSSLRPLVAGSQPSTSMHPVKLHPSTSARSSTGEQT